MKKSQKSESNILILIQSSLVGIWRGLVGLPFEHPFDNIKTNMQAYQTNFKKTYQRIYSQHGVLGFYSGFLVNSLRVVAKQIYRWPLQIALFGFYNNFFEQKIYRSTLGIVCGLNMAIIQVFFITPFQRLKVWLMTAHLSLKMRQYFYMFNVRALFDGILPVFYKQTISWVTYLGGTQLFKDIAYRYKDKSRQDYDLNSIEIMCVSSAVAILNTFFVMPIDCVKTQFQKNNNGEKIQNQISQKKRLNKTIKQIYNLYGWNGFYKGWQVKIIQYTINSLFTVSIFQQILKKYEQNFRITH